MFKNGKKTLSFLLAIAMIATLIPANIAFASTAEKGTALTSRADVAADIRFALFGDTHVTAFPEKDWTSPSVALDGIMDAYYTIDPNMDAFVMPGDVIYNVAPADEKTTDDVVKYNAVLAEINEEFPTASPASNIIWSMGNHEITLGAYKGTATTGFTAGTWEQEVADNHAKYEEALKRKPIDTYTVNGYTFVTSAPYDYLNNYVNPNDKTVMSAYETTIKGYLEAALNADPAKPVFYLQHEAIDRTNIASATAENPTRNSKEFRDFVVDHPRIITLSGHSHYAANDPRTFLQLENGSTHINIPATMGAAGSYGCTKDSVTDNASATQGMLVEVTGAEVTVRAFDYVDKKYIGEPYVFTAGAAAKAEYTKAGREAAKTSEVNKAYFESGAAITVSDIKPNGAKISFPEGKKDGESASGLHDDYIHYYRVRVTKKDNGNVVKSYSLLGNYLLNSTNSKKTANRVVTLSGLSRDTEYTVTVTPESALGQQGTPLTVDFTTSAEKTAAELALTKKFDGYNVAVGKPVTVDNGNYKNKANDGNSTASNSAYGSINELTIDLERRYAIDKINLIARGDSQALSNFYIQVSNDPDFADNSTKKVSTYTGDLRNGDSTSVVTHSVDLSGENLYRYVRFGKLTTGAYIYINEIEVYADVYMTEVSRNKTVVANKYHSSPFHSKQLVDGKNTGDESGWMSDWSTTHDWAYVDLENTLPIGLIEMETPVASSRVSGYSRTSWNVLGSNDLNTDALNSTVTGWKNTKPTDTEIYTNLFTIPINYYLPKATTSATLSTKHYVSQLLNDNTSQVGVLSQPVIGNYRYITFHHGIENLALLGEARVYAINPVIAKATKTDSTLTIEFNEPMEASTVNADNIVVTDVSENVIDGTYTLSDDGMTLTITGDMTNASKLDANYGVYSQAGMELAGDLTKYFESNIDLSGKAVVTVENANIVKGKPATVTLDSGETKWTMLTDGNKSTEISDSNYGYLAGNGEVKFDLGKRYNISKIVLTVNVDSQAKQAYKIQVSNDPAFTDSSTKTLKSRGTVNNLDEATEFVNGTTLTINLDGDASYRYVRYYNSLSSNKYLYMSEFEVYADKKLVEVSRGVTPTVSNTYSGYSVKGLTDGVNNSKNGGWASGWIDTTQWINVDLGMQLPIERVEMESVYNGVGDSDYNGRRGWYVYGSNITPTREDLSNAATIKNTLNPLLAEGYTLLDTIKNASMPSYNQGVFDEQVYYTPAEVLAKWAAESYGKENGILRIDFDTPGKYRYITFHKGYIGYANMGEVRVYTLAPFVSSYKLNDNTVTLNFTDAMFPNYMTTDYIKLYDADGNIVDMSSAEMVDTYTFRFTADLKPGATYKIVASKDMKTLESMPLNEDNEITIVVPNISTSVTVKATETDEVATDFTIGIAYNFNVAVTSPFAADEPNVKIVVAQYNGDKLVKAEVKDITAIANTTTPVVLENFTYAEGNTFKVFAWKANFDEPYCAIIELGTQE